MRMMVVIAAGMTAGCMTPSGDSPTYVGDGYCDAPAGASLVGQTANETTEEDAKRLTRATRARLIRPGEVVTMDYRMDRVNVSIGEDGKVTRVRCG